MLANAGLICCNSALSPSPFHPLKWPQPRRTSTNSQNSLHGISSPRSCSSRFLLRPFKLGAKVPTFQRKGKGVLQIRGSSLKDQRSEDSAPLEREGGGNGDGGEEGRDWSTSILLLGLWVALMYYVFNLTPNQTPSRDLYFLQKLLNLKGDDGFKMNEVLVSLWYILGLWPLVYSMLLLPTARSSKSSIPLWPFLVLSFGAGAYALLPYFVLWKPPSPPVEETELGRWPLNFLDSKLTAWITVAAGIVIFVYAGLADEDVWKEFYQYFKESKFVHISSVDFTLFSTLAPFWVFNDMTARKWYDKGSWLLPLSVVPFIGPSLYLALRPSLSSVPVLPSSIKSEKR